MFWHGIALTDNSKRSFQEIKENIFKQKKLSVMQKQSNGVSVILSEVDLVNFTTEANEYMPLGIEAPGRRIFSACDLWNIRRSIKATTIRKYL
jgi:hypothetical protein